MKHVVLLLMLVGCSKDISFDPKTTIAKELMKFIYNETSKQNAVME